MKRFFVNHLIIVALVVVAAFTGCKKDKPETNEPDGSIAVNLTTNISPVSILKVANDQWEVNDRVGLYMKRTGQTLSASGALYSNARNAQMSISNGTLTSTPEVMYPMSGNVDFIAYHPYNADVSADFTIPVNVAGQANGLPVEVLYSNNVTNQAPTSSAVMLNFLYSLAKIELTVTNGTNPKFTEADFAAMTATVDGLSTQAKLQLTNGTFTDIQDKQTVTLRKKSSNATSATFEFLALPTNEEVTFMFNVDGLIHIHKMMANYASATLYRYNFALDFPTVTLLNTHIVPRNEEPIQNVSVDASAPAFLITNTDEWNAALAAIRAGGDGTVGIPKTYVLYIKGDVLVPGNFALITSFGSVQHIEVTLIGNGTLSLESSGAMLRVGNNQTLIIDSENLTLQGGGDNISGRGLSIMTNGMLELKNGTISNFSSIDGDGVNVSGTFYMSGGIINNNYAGVLLGSSSYDSKFIMSGGAISGNIYMGVFIQSFSHNEGVSNFILLGGNISDNTGVGVFNFGSNFTMSGGTISGNTSNAFNSGGVRISNGNFTMSGGADVVVFAKS